MSEKEIRTVNGRHLVGIHIPAKNVLRFKHKGKTTTIYVPSGGITLIYQHGTGPPEEVYIPFTNAS